MQGAAAACSLSLSCLWRTFHFGGLGLGDVVEQTAAVAPLINNVGVVGCLQGLHESDKVDVVDALDDLD